MTRKPEDHEEKIILTSYVAVQALFDAARECVKRNEVTPELVKAVEELVEHARYSNSPVACQVREEARSRLHDEDGSVDEASIVYHNEEDGHWVEAWLFVEDEEAEADMEDEAL